MVISDVGLNEPWEENVKQRNDQMLLFIALGDATGVATEYVRKDEFPELIRNVLLLDGYKQHPRHHEMQTGYYSDDTQMSIAVAEVLILPHVVTNPRSLLKLDFAHAFIQAYMRDRRNGYSRSFQTFLDSVRGTDDFLHRIQSKISEKNGAAMRAVPIGVMRTPGDVLITASIQASTTHDTRIGRFGSRAVALMSHFALYETAGFDRLYAYLMDYMDMEFRELCPNLRSRKRGPVLQPATQTVHAVFDLLTNQQTLAQVLRGAISMGGDTDTVAAIALGIASARMRNDIPQVMFDTLEPHRNDYGVDFLKTLGRKLMDSYA